MLAQEQAAALPVALLPQGLNMQEAEAAAQTAWRKARQVEQQVAAEVILPAASTVLEAQRQVPA